MYRLRAAQHQLRPLARRTRPMVLPSGYATDTGAHAAADHRRRGARRPRPLAVLGPRRRPQHAGADRARRRRRPRPARHLPDNGWGSNFAQDYTPLGADFAWMYDDGYGGTNLECTSPGDTQCWGHRDNILGPWTTTGTQTAQMGDADTTAGQYTQLFANQVDPADTRHRSRDAERTAHAVDRRRTRRGPGPARLLAEHGGRHAGDDRGQLLQHGDRRRRSSSEEWPPPTST